MKNKCSWCGEIGHFGVDCPRVKQYAVCTKCGNIEYEYNRCPTFLIEKKPRIWKRQFEIDEKLKDTFDFIKVILKNLPRVSIEESMKYILEYERKIYETVKKFGEQDEINYIAEEGQPRFIPITCEANIQGIETEAIVDMGAAVTVITKGLVDQLPYELKPSRTKLTPFGKERYASLGVIENMEFFVGDTKTKATVEVVDLPQQLFLLGTDWI